MTLFLTSWTMKSKYDIWSFDNYNDVMMFNLKLIMAS